MPYCVSRCGRTRLCPGWPHGGLVLHLCEPEQRLDMLVLQTRDGSGWIVGVAGSPLIRPDQGGPLEAIVDPRDALVVYQRCDVWKLGVSCRTPGAR